jgi:hypothetical protein
MSTGMNRRSFLKFLATLPAATIVPKLAIAQQVTEVLNLAKPAELSDAVTKSYIDAQQGNCILEFSDLHLPCRAEMILTTTALNIDLARPPYLHYAGKRPTQFDFVSEGIAFADATKVRQTMDSYMDSLSTPFMGRTSLTPDAAVWWVQGSTKEKVAVLHNAFLSKLETDYSIDNEQATLSGTLQYDYANVLQQ